MDEIKNEKAIIDKVLPRKNVMIRPYVSNIDCLVIVVSKVPAPDWILVEKLILNCYIENIEPVLCYHKCELATIEEIEKAFSPYKNEISCIKTSIKDEEIGLKDLYKVIDGKLACFAGQSAVGKSSIINNILKKNVMETGELSQRIERCTKTTRHIEIFTYGKGSIIDTCGFSMMEFKKIKSEDLNYYYDDFVKAINKCQYRNCTHINEPKCEVKKQVELGNISKERYDRYVAIYKEIKEMEDKQYD